jgi:hypothetical protein
MVPKSNSTISLAVSRSVGIRLVRPQAVSADVNGANEWYTRLRRIDVYREIFFSSLRVQIGKSCEDPDKVTQWERACQDPGDVLENFVEPECKSLES